MRKMKKWKAWALLGDRQDWAFDVYLQRSEAGRVKCIGERIIRVIVRELPQRRGRK